MSSLQQSLDSAAESIRATSVAAGPPYVDADSLRCLMALQLAQRQGDALSAPRLAEAAGITVSQARRHLKALQKVGLLAQSSRGWEFSCSATALLDLLRALGDGRARVAPLNAESE